MLAFYKPSMSGKGHAFSFKLFTFEGEEEPAFLMEAIKQTGAMGKPGTFKGGQQIAVKLNVNELGAIVDGVEQDFATKVSLFHKFEKNSTGIAFYKLEKDPTKTAINISRGEAKFGVALTRGELVTLREFLKWAMRQMFDAAQKANKFKRKPVEEAANE